MLVHHLPDTKGSADDGKSRDMLLAHVIIMFIMNTMNADVHCKHQCIQLMQVTPEPVSNMQTQFMNESAKRKALKAFLCNMQRSLLLLFLLKQPSVAYLGDW